MEGIQLDYNGNKGFRLLALYERLIKGEVVDKTTLARDFSVTTKTIQRDIDDLRAYLAQTHITESETYIKYDRFKKGYYMVRFEREWLTNEEVLALSKIALESRAFNKEEINGILKKLLEQTVPTERKTVEEIIKNEKHYYIPPQHNTNMLEPIWELAKFIKKNEIIGFEYKRMDGKEKEHRIKPIAIMFSEYYFYLVAFMEDESKENPTIFRIDRMKNIKGIGKKFLIPYRNKFSDGEFRKRIQFMYSGELKRVTFEFTGPSLEAILDRLPTAQILKEENGVYTIRAETYGDGILMWLRTQGDWVKML